VPTVLRHFEEKVAAFTDVQLKNPGKLYFCFVQSGGTIEDNELNKPTSWQIYNGVGKNNYPCDKAASFENPALSVAVLQLNSNFYDVYLTAANSDQVYQEILSDDKVVSFRVDMVSRELPSEQIDEDDWSVLLGVFLLIFLV
jgi:hypothetical protein